jgi:uncharacterized membrane protein
MTIALWIVAGLLALAFFVSGLSKLIQPRAKLEVRMGYVADFTDAQVKLIGAAEVLGAVGLIVPTLTGILPLLTPIAAFALVVLQIGAAATHIRRKESFVTNLVLVALTLFVGVGRLLVAG